VSGDIQATGADLMAFYEAWPMGRDWAHEEYDETLYTNDGERPELVPEKLYSVQWTIGNIIYQGPHPPPTLIDVGCGVEVRFERASAWVSTDEMFSAWLATQAPSEPTQLDRIEALLRQLVLLMERQ